MPHEHPLAPLWRRLVALCYESLLLCAVLMVSGGAFQLLLGGAGIGATQIADSPVWRNVLGVYLLAVLYGYFAWCWGRGGQTLAMKTWRLQLRTQANQLPGARAITVRFLLVLVAYAPPLPTYVYGKHMPNLKWLFWTSCVLAALPWLWALVDKEKQTLFDRLAGTRVVLLPVARAD
ncbi:RDD family protein [Chitinimonas sp.]|uniref:RDD family protein n=1 Tax=Chitinimonas sp. TaxID=1934313 RepID=UPI002F94B204